MELWSYNLPDIFLSKSRKQTAPVEKIRTNEMLAHFLHRIKFRGLLPIFQIPKRFVLVRDSILSRRMCLMKLVLRYQNGMVIIFKNKGILVPVYFIGSIVVVMTIGKYLWEALFGPTIFSEGSFPIALGFSCLLTCVLVYLTKNDYYVDKNGDKQRMDIENSFFLIKMEYWVYIFFILGIIAFVSSLF